MDLRLLDHLSRSVSPPRAVGILALLLRSSPSDMCQKDFPLPLRSYVRAHHRC